MDQALCDRIAKLIALCGSPNDGEALAAARAIGRALVSAGSDWHALAAHIRAGKAGKAPPAADDGPKGYGSGGDWMPRNGDPKMERRSMPNNIVEISAWLRLFCPILPSFDRLMILQAERQHLAGGLIHGATADACTTIFMREWFRVNGIKERPDPKPQQDVDGSAVRRRLEWLLIFGRADMTSWEAGHMNLMRDRHRNRQMIDAQSMKVIMEVHSRVWRQRHGARVFDWQPGDPG